MFIQRIDEEQGLHLIFEFDNGNLAFECPIGMDILEAMDALKSFVATTEDLFNLERTVH
tara:strand:- start:277 stop:453 length:177 start_codon:yes stop_codon:yes gene_type:complete